MMGMMIVECATLGAVQCRQMTLCRELLNLSHDSYQPMNHRCAYDFVTTEKDIGGHADAYISRSMSWHVEGLTLLEGT
ncbi:hypothetical protein BO83DRAFT_154390 [Aspergillus eucalypticola CBS 122712]|uniref:Uncharacterized protein n=1 Tax=Aspergillus eucalypticola (strain CBS 122712 / IBT 29274) TaxID=1448314 RepID=A0A317UNM2_ASPEC|nr:uncharacterized protein BO83DRAFT_154390 [Aspergillus eucalypticola CBS 122712]PWY63583.1 hypothetical protein BO83DRAFT_154390 [Aspergillus eucalypticola CBS 122712]